jgi:hypothetical protein
LLRSRRLVALVAGVTAATLGLSSHSACAQSADPIFGSIAAPAGGWLAGTRAGYDLQHGAGASGGGTDASATPLGGPMSGGGVDAAASQRATEAAATSGWVAWSGIAPLGPGQPGFGGGFDTGFSTGFSTLGLGLASLQLAMRPGSVSGGGVGYLVRPDLSVSFGYQQVDLGTSSLATGTAMRALTEGAATRVQSVSAGVNWRFAPNATLSLGVAGHFAGSDTGGQSRSAWDNGGDAVSSASIVAPPR